MKHQNLYGVSTLRLIIIKAFLVFMNCFIGCFYPRTRPVFLNIRTLNLPISRNLSGTFHVQYKEKQNIAVKQVKGNILTGFKSREYVTR